MKSEQRMEKSKAGYLQENSHNLMLMKIFILINQVHSCLELETGKDEKLNLRKIQRQLHTDHAKRSAQEKQLR